MKVEYHINVSRMKLHDFTVVVGKNGHGNVNSQTAEFVKRAIEAALPIKTSEDYEVTMKSVTTITSMEAM